VIDFLHGGEAGRIDLGGAAGDDDLGLGAVAAGFSDRLSRLAHGLRRHRAGVDDHRLFEPGGVGLRAHDFGFIDVEPATEGDDVEIRHVSASNMNWRASQTLARFSVIPAKAGIQRQYTVPFAWIPACAGMTRRQTRAGCNSRAGSVPSKSRA
jgi:hypothetical protein